MKKTILLSIVLGLTFFSAKSQVVLDRLTHSPIAGDVISYSKVSFVDPGSSGKDIIWNFSELNILDETTVSEPQNPNEQVYTKINVNSNIAISEKDLTYCYKLDEKSYELVGIIADTYTINYDKPVTKMLYPFTFNSYVSGDFQADAAYNTNYSIDIFGNYTVEADAYGMLILPNNIVKNVVRVKQYSKSTQISVCDDVEIDAYKYAWYSADERYPIVTTIVQEQHFSNGDTKFIQETYVNQRVFNSEDNIMSDQNVINLANAESFIYSVSPNPFLNVINISYQLNQDFNVDLGIYNILGEKVKDIVIDENQNKGAYTYTVETNEIGLTPGMYFVKFAFGNRVALEKIIRTQ